MIDGYILTGGASSRMGADKAHLRLGGLSFVERIARALNAVTMRVSVVSSKADAEVWGLPVVRDVHAGCGAIGGVHAALAHSQATCVVIVSCDLPFVSAELFARLASLSNEDSHKVCDGDRERARVEESREIFDAVAPVQADGFPQPLCAIYRREVCLPVTERLIEQREFRPRRMLQEVRTRWVGEHELSDLDGSSFFFLNVNTPADYAAARSLADPVPPPGIK
ncbi:MAG: molybdenum cofactor guanylyltransferase [Pyrinomonadaceae bacterium]|nr:molybdenum cofactor guanylyltransferase [Pyrinomonadaceae bacterium]